MDEIIIRIATEKDWPDIVRIYNQAIDDRYCTADTEHISVDSRQEWFRQHDGSHYPIFMAEKGDAIIGWCSLSPYRPGRKALRTAAEISYYIEREYRKQGVGSSLMAHAIDEAGNFGFKNLFAILLDVNPISIKMLEQFGFVKWGHLPEIAEIEGAICGQFIYGRKV